MSAPLRPSTVENQMPAPTGRLRRTGWHSCLANRKCFAGGILLALLVMSALLAPILAPHDPVAQDVARRLEGPSLDHPLGTDHFGRCILSRLIHGSRTSLFVAIAVLAFTVAAGCALGLVSGYLGGAVDRAVMALVDLFLAVPGLLLVIVVAGVLGQGIFNLVLVLALEGWKGYCRVVRGVVLSEKEKDHVVAARALGANTTRVVSRHLLPAAVPAVLVMAMLNTGHVILAAAGLGFLGLGTPPPAPEWGAMINEGRFFLRTAPGLTLWPGLAILLTILSFNLLGEGLQELLNPRLRGRAPGSTAATQG